MSEVRLERDGAVAVLTLAAPERRNALTPAMVEELLQACEEIDADPAVGAVVVQGEGEGFCAGAHRDSLAAAGRDPAKDEHYRGLGRTYRAFARVGELAPPTIAAVRGAAVGAGVNLALATDLRVMAHDARIITGFARIGIHPGGGHFALLGRLVGRDAAAALGLFGVEIDGRRAAEIGLAWESLPAEQVEPRARELARQAGADPELARQAAASMRLELGPPALGWAAALELERAPQMWSLRRRAN
ncbi:MAG TPA: enoyl-CoA hydratase-related protein [Candidatus Dormibacteraeota bacterium]|nr:enoyl-CoA hydratase-related protein [Candidatus Dormibacteraeota bacterium]